MADRPTLTEWRRLIESIHHAPLQCVLAMTGGGSSAIADLLVVPGGSRTVLEATVPYSATALAEYLGRPPEQYCSEETALAMAAVAYERGCRLADRRSAELARSPDANAVATAIVETPESTIVGIACTAALVSDRPKRGEHRCFVAWQSASTTVSASLVLEKGARDRAGEEGVVGGLILVQLARAAGIVDLPLLELRSGETVAEQRVDGAPLLVDLRRGRRNVVWSLPGGELVEELGKGRTERAAKQQAAAGVLCGAFNPLHFGHQELRAVAEKQLGRPVYYELSLRNVDKPPLDYLTIERRRAQFIEHPLALTSAPTFAEKAQALPGVVFVVGVDTAERIVQTRYYGDSERAVLESLARIRDQGCRFLVAGRVQEGRFRTLADVAIPGGFAGLFDQIPEASFRADVSSTELRQQHPQ